MDTMEEKDSIQEHYRDSLEGGSCLADTNALYAMVKAAPSIVKELEKLGVPFHRNGNGILLRNMGGQKKKRTAYVKNSTGKMLMTAMIDETRKYEACGIIKRLPHHKFLKLYLEEQSCKGCFVKELYAGDVCFLEGAVLFACGGLNGMFGDLATGSRSNTGEAAATAFYQGVEMGNLEFIQFHPTTFAIPGKRCLVSEAAREMSAVCKREGCESQVYLDMTEISQTVWKQKLSDLREECRHYLHKDPIKEPVPVEPGIHYFMGGILVDRNHRTNIRNVYAAGECACQYHGANRLGGNSLLGAIYGGKTAAQSVSEELQRWKEVAYTPLFSLKSEDEDMREVRRYLKEGLGLV